MLLNLFVSQVCKSKKNDLEKVLADTNEVNSLKEKLKEIEDTEQALKNTMEKADEILFNRQKDHEEKLKEMEEALKKLDEFNIENYMFFLSKAVYFFII